MLINEESLMYCVQGGRLIFHEKDATSPWLRCLSKTHHLNAGNPYDTYQTTLTAKLIKTGVCEEV